MFTVAHSAHSDNGVYVAHFFVVFPLSPFCVGFENYRRAQGVNWGFSCVYFLFSGLPCIAVE